jgi:hypothetical protein
METKCRGRICVKCPTSCKRSHRFPNGDLVLRKSPGSTSNRHDCCYFCYARNNWINRKIYVLDAPVPTLSDFAIRRQQLVDLVVGQRCAECGLKATQDNPHEFEFDHLDPEMKCDSIGSMVARAAPMKEIMNELKATEPVCIECHKYRTWIKDDPVRVSSKWLLREWAIARIMTLSVNGSLQVEQESVHLKLNLRAIAKSHFPERRL